MTIPYEITQYLKNATHKYRNIDYSIIELRHDDDFLEKIGKGLNPNYTYIYDVDKCILIVKYPNKTQGKFDLNSTSKEDIEAFYESSKKKQCEIKVYYELKDNDYIEFKNKYKNDCKLPKIPKTWRAHFGGGCSGFKYFSGSVYFKGPMESSSKVKQIINSFYEGFSYNIE